MREWIKWILVHGKLGDGDGYGELESWRVEKGVDVYGMV